jgi:cold shock CspA family protein
MGDKPMRGNIKFVDPQTRKWGFIIPADNGRDVHFQTIDFSGVAPGPSDAGAEVEFELVEDTQGRHAKSIHFLAPPPPSASPQGDTVPGDALKKWAYIPFFEFRGRDGRNYASVLHLLSSMGMEERWFFGESVPTQEPYPVLDSYLKYTFLKLKREKKVIENNSYATFNTGLVDRLYDPIFGLFEANPKKGYQHWAFLDFCVPGKGISGKKLTSVFDPLPDPPAYFSSNFDMLLDPTKDIHVDYEHVISDGIARDRFPGDFLRQHCPRGYTWEDMESFTYEEKRSRLDSFVKALNDDVQCLRGIKGRLEDAKFLAEKRTRWNFKTAIPQYYPRYDKMSFLLPLSLMDDRVVDIALVVTRNPSGSYQGRTVLPLAWAYKNARLICRPDSDWLEPRTIRDNQDQPDFEE